MQLRFQDQTAEVRRRFDASPTLVFAAFSDPALVNRWLKPGPEVMLDVLDYDFVPDGLYRFAYHTPNAGIMHVNGAFRVIRPPMHLVFTWNIEPPDEHAGVRSEVHITIEACGDGAELVIRHINLSQTGAPARHAEGWCGALEGLARLLAEQPAARRS